METKLLRIAELAKSDPRMKFTSIAHLLDKQKSAKFKTIHCSQKTDLTNIGRLGNWN